MSTPEGALDLRRRGEKDFLITIGGRILMSSAAHRSEDALAKLACAGLRKKRAARVLVSGLGMGFTLRTALDELADDAEVTVAELNPAVIEWCRGPLAPLTAAAARDPRVTLEVIDVARLIAQVARDSRAPRFDAIVLDMYQGPQHLVRADEPLYGHVAVRRTKEALTPGGVFAIWCEAASNGFELNLRGAGFHYRLERAGRGSGSRTHCVYVASETAPPPTRPGQRPARGAARPKKG